jgi:hypothetical protein
MEPLGYERHGWADPRARGFLRLVIAEILVAGNHLTRKAQPPLAAASVANSQSSFLNQTCASERPAVGCSAWLGEFNFPKHDDGFFVADLALIYRPSVLFIN